jgi:peptide/nickel transport system permease protein
MSSFLMKRTITAVLVLLGATFLTYAMMMFAPGDAAMEIAVARYGDEAGIDKATMEWIRKKEGLDKPFLHQYLFWLKHVSALDLGKSLVEETDVMELILAGFSQTLMLAVAAILVAFLISVPLGILAGIKQGTWIDSAGVTIAALGISMPNYWLGLLLIIIFSVKLQWLPCFGRGGWEHLILPAITLGTALTVYTTRMLRSAIIEALNSEHLLALRARGVVRPHLFAKHLLKNALIPVITVIGIEFGMILEGAVITETVFGWPGLGDLLVSAISNRDYPLIQGLVLFSAVIFIFINFMVDIICRSLDPRIRLS